MAKERNGRHLTPNPRARSERRVDQATSHGLLRVFLAVILVAVSFVGGFGLRRFCSAVHFSLHIARDGSLWKPDNGSRKQTKCRLRD